MLNGAIVGFGNVAQFGHYPSYASRTDVRIVAVVDAAAGRRDVATSLDPSLRTFGSLDEMAGAVAVDFVDICTPPALHIAPMRFAIGRGWHVLCEKPLLLHQSEFDEVRESASVAGVAVVPVHNWRYAPILRRAAELLRGGSIGQLRRVEITTLRVRDAAVADDSQPNWRRDPALSGGGILMDHGWHAIYLALGWFDERPERVEAELHRAPRAAAEDEATLNLTFAAGTATIVLSWNATVRANTIRLRGEGGEILINEDTLQLGGTTERFLPALSAGSHHPDWFAAMLPDVLAAFGDPESARPKFEEAAACFEIIQRAYAG
jgi:predicted dehydrogenase